MIIFTEVMAEVVKTIAVDREVRLELSEDKLQITISPPRSTEEPINKKVAPQRRLAPSAYTYEFNGKSKSAKEWAKEYGCTANTILHRFKHHGSPEPRSVKTDDGSTERTRSKPKKLYEWDGRALAAEEWAKEYNCNTHTMQERFRRNGSPEPLVKTKTDKRKVK